MPDHKSIDPRIRELLVERGAGFVAKSTLRGDLPSLAVFAGELIRGYGEEVRPHIEKIWSDAWNLYESKWKEDIEIALVQKGQSSSPDADLEPTLSVPAPSAPSVPSVAEPVRSSPWHGLGGLNQWQRLSLSLGLILLFVIILIPPHVQEIYEWRNGNWSFLETRFRRHQEGGWFTGLRRDWAPNRSDPTWLPCRYRDCEQREHIDWSTGLAEISAGVGATALLIWAFKR